MPKLVQMHPKHRQRRESISCRRALRGGQWGLMSGCLDEAGHVRNNAYLIQDLRNMHGLIYASLSERLRLPDPSSRCPQVPPTPVQMNRSGASVRIADHPLLPLRSPTCSTRHMLESYENVACPTSSSPGSARSTKSQVPAIGFPR